MQKGHSFRVTGKAWRQRPPQLCLQRPHSTQHFTFPLGHEGKTGTPANRTDTPGPGVEGDTISRVGVTPSRSVPHPPSPRSGWEESGPTTDPHTLACGRTRAQSHTCVPRGHQELACTCCPARAVSSLGEGSGLRARAAGRAFPTSEAMESRQPLGLLRIDL